MSRNISICRDLFLDIAMQFSYNITTRKEEKKYRSEVSDTGIEGEIPCKM